MTSGGSAIAALGLAVLTACGGGGHQPEPSRGTQGEMIRTTGGDADVGDGAAELHQLAELEAELARLLPVASTRAPQLEAQELAEPTAPDCDAAPDLRDRICELAGRICQLAERNPDDDGIADRCKQATESCERAQADVANACGA